MDSAVSLPRNVRLFEVLSCLSLFLGFAEIPFDPEIQAAWTRLLSEEAALGISFLFVLGAIFFLLMAIVVAVFVALVWLVARRRKNWARWLFLFLNILVTAVFLFDPPLFYKYPLSVVGIVDGLTTLMGVAALILIFTGDARPWFSVKKPASA